MPKFDIENEILLYKEALAKLIKSIFLFSPQVWGELEGGGF